MLPFIIALIALCGIAAIALYAGIVIARVMREQFDALLPQRMVDYSGFVDVRSHRD